MTNNLPENAAEADALIEAISRLLTESAPPGWAEIRMDFRGTSTICQMDLSGSTMEGGQLLMPPPPDLAGLLRELRAVMYTPGRGTWFSLRAKVKRDADPDFRFNFTDDPGWSPPVAPTAFTLDQERFPREPRHIPDWLRARLEEAVIFEQEFQDRESEGGTGTAL
jgi:hypothetical protein